MQHRFVRSVPSPRARLSARWLPWLWSALLLATLLLAAGAARGQDAGLRLQAILNGDNVVSATDSPATGEARATLRDDGSVRINLVYGGLSSDVTGASLHVGTSAENGPAAMALDVRENQTVGSLVDEELQLGDELAARMRAGETYLLVSTVEHPSGAIRGQLLPQPVRLRDQPLEPEEED